MAKIMDPYAHQEARRQLGKLADLAMKPQDAQRIRKFAERLPTMQFVPADLECRGGGGGTLSFSWRTSDKFDPITRELAEAYLKSDQAKHLREQGWELVERGRDLLVIRPVTFIGTDRLRIACDDAELMYHVAPSQANDPEDVSIRDYQLTLQFQHLGEWRPVANLSTRAVVLDALERRRYEEARNARSTP